MEVKRAAKLLIMVTLGCLIGVQFVPIWGTLAQASLVMLKSSMQT